MTRKVVLLFTLAACSGACSGTSAQQRAADDENRRAVTNGVKQQLVTQVDEWLRAAIDLQNAAPAQKDRGWDTQSDAAALAAMRAAWLRGRRAYELVEGALAPMFRESDTATDARYEDFLAVIGAGGDRDPFDGEGVVGMHGIERILFLDSTPERVRIFESGLPGHSPARRPATAAEASRFKTALCGRLVNDVKALRTQLEPLQLDLGFAWNGLLDLVNEQVEKIDKTASGEEESRYAQTTLDDLRANQTGVQQVYALFRPWLLSKPGGADLDNKVAAAFARLRAAMDAHPGAAMPEPPARWSSVRPREADLATPFGKLWSAVKNEADESRAGSLHHTLLQAASLLQLPGAS